MGCRNEIVKKGGGGRGDPITNKTLHPPPPAPPPQGCAAHTAWWPPGSDWRRSCSLSLKASTTETSTWGEPGSGGDGGRGGRRTGVWKPDVMGFATAASRAEWTLPPVLGGQLTTEVGWHSIIQRQFQWTTAPNGSRGSARHANQRTTEMAAEFVGPNFHPFGLWKTW